MTARILEQVAAGLRDRASEATDARVTVGARVLLVEVVHPDHGRLAGLAHTPEGTLRPLDGASPTTLVERATAADASIERAAGVAALNALSVPDVDWRTGDPMAALSPDVDAVATVGLFRPAFRKFDDVEVRVVERDPPADVRSPPEVRVATYPPAECAAAFDGADVCFVTGSALVYGGVDRYLSALSAAGVAPVVLVGATASHRPEPAFDAGVDVVAGARVTDVDRVRERALAGDCGTDLHDAGVEKVYVARPPTDDGPPTDGIVGMTPDEATSRRAEPASWTTPDRPSGADTTADRPEPTTHDRSEPADDRGEPERRGKTEANRSVQE